MAFQAHNNVAIPILARLLQTLIVPLDLAVRLEAIPSECDLPPASPGPLLISTLQPHQAHGLSFMLKRERLDCLAARCLWRDQKIDTPTPVWNHQINYREIVSRTLPDRHAVEMPPPSFFQGSILTDRRGLGKTIQSISLIDSRRTTAARYLKTTQDLKASRPASCATLIVCAVCLLATWREEIFKHAHPRALQLIMYYRPDINNFHIE